MDEERQCKKHGLTRHFSRKEGGWRCRACESERIAAKRRDLKLNAVEERGGKCELCGYDRYIGSLHFHHRDPATKSFGLASKGYTRSRQALKEEIEKCILLCANCHGEVEAEIIVL